MTKVAPKTKDVPKLKLLIKALQLFYRYNKETSLKASHELICVNGVKGADVTPEVIETLNSYGFDLDEYDYFYSCWHGY